MRSLSELQGLIDEITDSEDRELSKCMLVLIEAVEVGADVDSIVERTGYPRDFIEDLSRRMRSAGLWIRGLVDDREWWDERAREGFGIFLHAHVALGRLLREPNGNGGFKYRNPETGEVEVDWNPRHRAPNPLNFGTHFRGCKEKEMKKMNDTRLNLIKEEIRGLDPELRSDEPAFQAAVILMAAAFVTGPNTERLSSFTGYPAGVVADISKRMHEVGLWENGTVKTDHWFDGDKWTAGFWADTLVAEGLVVTRHREDGEREYRVRDKGELH